MQQGKVLLLFCYSAVSGRATLTNLQQVESVPPLCTELTEAVEQNCGRLHLYSKMVAMGPTLERLASPNYTNLFISCKAGCLKEKKQTKKKNLHTIVCMVPCSTQEHITLMDELKTARKVNVGTFCALPLCR